MDDFMDDLFDGDSDTSGGKKVTKDAPAPDSGRRDSELENLFNEVGLDTEPKVEKSASNNSLDDMDTFLNELDKTSPAKVQESGESDEFLSWLEDDNANDKQQDEQEEDEDDDNDDDFYLGQGGSVMVQQESAQVSDTKKGDRAPETDKAIDSGGSSPLSPVEALASTHQELEQPVADHPLLPSPEVSFVSQDMVSQTIQVLEDVRATEDADDAALSKVQNRLETLFEIGQTDRTALYAAVKVNGTAGLVVPSSSRAQVWATVLAGKTIEQLTVQPDWAMVPEDRLEEIFPSVRKNIQRDCAAAIKAFGTKHLDQDQVAQQVCRLVLRQRSKIYNVLLTNIVVPIASVFRSHALSLEKCGTLIEALCLRWGGASGDWSSTGLDATSVNCKGVGGSAWSPFTLCLTAFRRHTLLCKLVAYFDPILACWLATRVEGWNSWPASQDEQEVDAKSTAKVLSRCKSVMPSDNLFGKFASIQQDGAPSCLSGAQVLELWDAAILSDTSPQLYSFFLAVAALMVLREDMLKEEVSENLQKQIDRAFSTLVERRQLNKVFALTAALVELTPASVRDIAAEDDLLLNVADEAALAVFDAGRVQRKRDEQELIRANDAARQEALGLNHFGNDDDDEKVEFQSSEGASKTRWLSAALTRQAQTLKSTLAAAARGLSAVDWSKVKLSRRLVQFDGNNGADLGLVLKKSAYGIQVDSVAKDSLAAETGLVDEGDLIMTLNGLLVMGLSVGDLYALINIQERPFFMVVASILGPDDPLDEGVPSLCPSLAGRIKAYYARYNPEKEKEVARILSIYSHREPVLLDELATKYMDHIAGDPFSLSTSHFCVPVRAADVVHDVCFMEHSHPSPLQQGHQSAPQPKPTPAHAKKIFVVDCRPADVIASTGKFATCFVLDPANLNNTGVRADLLNMLGSMRCEMQIAILGTGNHLLLEEFNSKRARLLRETDRRVVDTCALMFLQAGFPFVGVVEGGFLACYKSIRDEGYQIDDCLVNLPERRTILAKYDAFIRFRKSSPSAAATFLASKARISANSLSARAVPASTTQSIQHEVQDPLANAGSLGSLLKNVWKGDEQQQGVGPSQSATQGPGNVTDDNNKLPGTPSASVSSDSGTKDSSEGFFSSVFKKDGGQKKEEAKSWFSSKMKSIRVPENFGDKLRTSMTQAYSTAQTKLASVVTELNGPSDGPMTEFKIDPASSERVAALEKGNLVHLVDLGRYTRHFSAFKEKIDSSLGKEVQVHIIRILAVTGERLLVLDPHPSKPGYATVKSNHSLKDVVRMRFANKDPSRLTLLYKKEDVEPVPRTYWFQEGSDDFRSSLMHACVSFNKRAREIKARPVGQPTSKEVPTGEPTLKRNQEKEEDQNDSSANIGSDEVLI